MKEEKLKKIIFATHNQHKIKEMREIIGLSYQIIGLNDLGFIEEIPETADTLNENAIIKAEYIYNKTGLNCFSDDTGLEIDALNGAPGVYSARFAGENCSFDDNIKKVLQAMQGKTNRKARFRCIVCLIINGKKHIFEGKTEGKIIEKEHGTNGFGYDPIFVPDGFDATFAEMPATLKNRISHRAIATQKLSDFLNSIL